MNKKQFQDFLYDNNGNFTVPCSDCKKQDPEGQGEFWGCVYLCPECNDKTIIKMKEDFEKAENIFEGEK